jgi:shikimate dehydrogenase
MEIGTDTRVYALIGDPIEHSLSPLMQNLAFRLLGLDCVYLAFRVKAEELGWAIKGIRALGVSGFNVTVPHKVAVIPLLDEVDHSASDVGAVNTVTNRGGRLVGHNTDGSGALAALSDEGVDLKGKKVVILGAGGAARAIAFATAHTAGSLVIMNRTTSKAEELSTDLKKRYRNLIEARKLSHETLSEELVDAEVLINATSVGMSPRTEESLVNRHMIRPKTTVFDIVYNPLETKLISEAKAAGAKTIGGAKMLVYQGALSFEIWTGIKAPVDEMLKAVIRRLKEAQS